MWERAETADLKKSSLPQIELRDLASVAKCQEFVLHTSCSDVFCTTKRMFYYPRAIPIFPAGISPHGLPKSARDRNPSTRIKPQAC